MDGASFLSGANRLGDDRDVGDAMCRFRGVEEVIVISLDAWIRVRREEKGWGINFEFWGRGLRVPYFGG